MRAIRRGYWLDEELMDVTGIASSAVLKKLLALDAVCSDYIGRPEGGRVRAWSARNVLRAYIIKRIADAGRMSLLASGRLFAAISPRYIDEQLGVDGLLEVFQRQIDALQRDGNRMVAATLGPIRAPNLVVLDWQIVRWIDPDGAEEGRPVAKIRQLDGPSPDISGIVRDAASKKHAADLTVHMGVVVEEFLRAIER